MPARKRGEDAIPGRKRSTKSQEAKDATAQARKVRRVDRAKEQKEEARRDELRKAQEAQHALISSMNVGAAASAPATAVPVPAPAIEPASTANSSLKPNFISPAPTPSPMHEPHPTDTTQAQASTVEPPSPAPSLLFLASPHLPFTPVQDPSSGPEPDGEDPGIERGHADQPGDPADPDRCDRCDDDVCDDIGDADLDNSLKEGSVVHKYIWQVRRQLQWEDTGAWPEGAGPQPTRRWILNHIKKHRGEHTRKHDPQRSYL